MKTTLKTIGMNYLTMFLLIFAVAHTALADECLSSSPSISQMGETPYDPIDVRELTSPEYQKLSKLFRSLDGNWHGTTEQFFCRSDGDPSDVDIDHPTIKAKVRVDRNSNLELSADLYSERDRTSSQENLWLYLNDRKLRLNNDNGTGDVELLSVSDDKVAFFIRHVLQSGISSGSARQERFFTITKAADEFTIKMSLYVQGRLSSGYTWRFKKE